MNKTTIFENEVKEALKKNEKSQLEELWKNVERFPNMDKKLRGEVNRIVSNLLKERDFESLVAKHRSSLQEAIQSRSVNEIRKVVNTIENNSKLLPHFKQDLPKAKKVVEEIEKEASEKQKRKEKEKERERVRE